MADFARLPNQRKVLVFVVAGLMIGLLYWQFVFKGLKGDLEQAQAQHDSKVAQSKKLDNDIKDFTELKPTINKLLERISENEATLPTEAELPAFFETLNSKVIESGVQVNRSQKKDEEKVESFVRVPVDFEIQGTFMQIKRFFALLVPHKRAPGQTAEPASTDNGDSGDADQHERIVSIDNLSIGDPQVRNHELVLTARFTANTFRKEEAALPAPPPGAKPASTVAPPAPLPPAATPAGAKARLDDAMKKSQERSSGSAAKLKGGI